MTDAGMSQGLLHLAGSSFEVKSLVERLLAEDWEKHHCFYGKVGFHNHLPHHILAAYDLGAPPKVLQKIYDAEAEVQSPINLVDRKEQKVAPPDVTITKENWTEHLGLEKNYAAYLAFFMTEVQKIGVAESLDVYIFSPRANGNNNDMLLRFVGGAVHPLIQVGYGVEFKMASLVASGLAQTAMSRPIPSSLYDDQAISPSTKGPSLLQIIKMMYDSEALKPIMPYQPDALLSTRMKEALTDGRPEEIRRITSLWPVSATDSPEELNARVEEVIWAATLLTVATGKHGRKPRLDFFLMHLLTSSLFLPSLVHAIKTPTNKARLLRVFVPTMLLVMLVRGRPRIDPTLVTGYSPFPHPPGMSKDADPEISNPWPAILDDVIHAPDAHTVKVIRTLYYAAQQFGETPLKGAPGAFDEEGKEVLEGLGKLDGTVFVRTAGVVMDTLGWISHGQQEGKWDRSALGWDEAWDGSD